MSYDFYKILHLAAMICVFLAIGAQIALAMAGASVNKPLKKLLALTHGIGLTLGLVGGFGLLARLQLEFAGWLWIKLGFWVILGFIGAVIVRKPKLALPGWALLLLIAFGASYLGHEKPYFDGESTDTAESDVQLLETE
jgi:hypothetical protein